MRSNGSSSYKLLDVLSSSPGKLRVLRVIARMNLGGPAIQIAGISRHLDSELFEHLLVTGFCEDDEKDFLDINEVKVEVIRVKGLGRSISLIRDLKIVYQLRQIMKKWSPDIVHTHTAKAGFLGRVAALSTLRDIKLVHTFHGHVLRGYFGKLKSWVFLTLEKMLAKKTDVLVAVGAHVVKELVELKVSTASHFRIVPPGIEFDSQFSKEQAIVQYRLPASGLRVGFIGRLAQVKRPDRFLEVVRYSKSTFPELHFVVAGEGEYLEILQRATKKEKLPITFLGWVEDVINLLPALDLLILTSDNEGTPVSLIQGSYSGIPSIATNVGSVSEVVLDGKTGLLTEKNAIELFNALSILVKDEELRRQFSKEAKNFALSNFGAERLTRDYSRIYKELISR